jgi:hypothetical protein
MPMLLCIMSAALQDEKFGSRRAASFTPSCLVQVLGAPLLVCLRRLKP